MKKRKGFNAAMSLAIALVAVALTVLMSAVPVSAKSYYYYPDDYYYYPSDSYYYSSGSYYNTCPSPAPSTTTSTKAGVVISGVKVWDDNNNAARVRPSSITVGLYRYVGNGSASLVATRTVSASTNWEYSFDISSLPYTDSYGRQYKYKVVESSVSGYTEDTAKHVDPSVYFVTPSANKGWVRHTPCNILDIRSVGNENYCVVSKKGKDYIIWTYDALTENEKRLIYDSYSTSVAGMYGSAYNNVYFMSGIGASRDGITVYRDYISYDAHCKWSIVAKGLYKKSTPAEHSAKIVNKLNVADYSVRYLDIDTGKDLAPSKTVKGQLIGSTAAERYIDITNYKLVSAANINIKITADSSKNIGYFYYERKQADYTVRYLEKGTDLRLADPKVVTGNYVGTTATEKYIDITNYKLVSDPQISIPITEISSQNVGTFYYERKLADYTVYYLEKGTNAQLKTPKVVRNNKVGTTAYETYADIENYKLVSAASVYIPVTEDSSKNTAYFYYERKKADYTVYYLEEGTEEQVADPKVVKDNAVGTAATEDFIDIENYELVSEPQISIPITENSEDNEGFFYYKKKVADLTIYYLEKDTEITLKEPKTISGNIIGATVPTYYEEIEDYDLVSPESIPVLITADPAQNIAVYYYEKAKGTIIVQCFDSTTSAQIGGDVVVDTVPVGTSYSVYAPDLTVLKYSLTEKSPVSVTVVRGDNYVKFVYKRIK